MTGPSLAIDTESTPRVRGHDFFDTPATATRMPLDAHTPPSVSDSYVLIVSSDGTCVLNPRVPEFVGQKPWEWCLEEDQEPCREAFVQACMFRTEVPRFTTRMKYQGRVFKLAMHLYPLGDSGQVMCAYHRVFEGELTRRERHVLALIAGGADPKQTAVALDISPSTVRDYIAGIKKKLHIVSQEGFTMAAHHFGLTGNLSPDPAATETPAD